MKTIRPIHHLLVLSIVASCLWSSGCARTAWLPGTSWLNRDGSAAKSAAKSPAKVMPKNRQASDSTFGQQFSKARGFEAEKKYQRARAIYERLITQHPDRIESYHRLAVVADRQRRHREAEALYAEALRLDPMNGALLGDLGYCYFLQGKLIKAESALAKAVVIEPANSRHRNNLGLVYGHQGKIAEALQNFRRAGSEADAQYNLAFVLASQDKGAEAKRCFHAALMADPTHEKSHAALASFKRYEQTPEELRDEFTGSSDGRWVLHTETVDEASHVLPAVATGQGRVLQSQARQMMSSRAARR